METPSDDAPRPGLLCCFWIRIRSHSTSRTVLVRQLLICQPLQRSVFFDPQQFRFGPVFCSCLHFRLIFGRFWAVRISTTVSVPEDIRRVLRRYSVPCRWSHVSLPHRFCPDLRSFRPGDLLVALVFRCSIRSLSAAHYSHDCMCVCICICVCV